MVFKLQLTIKVHSAFGPKRCISFWSYGPTQVTYSHDSEPGPDNSAIRLHHLYFFVYHFSVVIKQLKSHMVQSNQQQQLDLLKWLSPISFYTFFFFFKLTKIEIILRFKQYFKVSLGFMLRFLLVRHFHLLR